MKVMSVEARTNETTDADGVEIYLLLAKDV